MDKYIQKQIGFLVEIYSINQSEVSAIVQAAVIDRRGDKQSVKVTQARLFKAALLDVLSECSVNQFIEFWTDNLCTRMGITSVQVDLVVDTLHFVKNEFRIQFQAMDMLELGSYHCSKRSLENIRGFLYNLSDYLHCDTADLVAIALEVEEMQILTIRELKKKILTLI